MAQTKGFEGLPVISFESRHAKAMQMLIEKHGGKPWIAPSMKEIPLEENPEALRFGEKLFATEIDILILLTGVGTRTLIEVLKTKYSIEQIKSSLQKITIVVRGPKPAAALAEIQLRANVTVPEPNTWHEILTAIDQNCSVKSRRVAVQEYGISNSKLIAELEKRGAQVFAVPVYQWALPDDTEPMKKAIEAVNKSEVRIILWTNAQQVLHVLKIAREIKY
ncbi:MAG: hypothetical protein A3A81_04050, partial [Omnitrophica bacterium RIFCSPLOWO2_01_FULL_45_10b]